MVNTGALVYGEDVRTLEVSKVGLLVEGGLVQTEGVDDIDDSLGLVVGTFVVAALSRGVGTNICRLLVLASPRARAHAPMLSMPMVILLQSAS